MSEIPQQNKNVLSKKALEKLRTNAESRQANSKYIKLASGEKKILRFNPEEIDQRVVDFNGNKTTRYEYAVIEQGSSQEKCLSVGKRTSERIDAYLSEGQYLLKIQRFGLGPTNTTYDVLAA